jgi:hypothetical protein
MFMEVAVIEVILPSSTESTTAGSYQLEGGLADSSSWFAELKHVQLVYQRQGVPTHSTP